MHFALLSLFSAILLIFSFPAADIASLAWIGLVPFFFMIEQAPDNRRLFLYSYAAGFVFWGGTVYWLCYVSVAVTVAAVAYGALYFSAFAWGCRFLRRRAGLSFIWTAPVLWCALEFARSHFLTGFPWALIGATQHRFLPLIQIAEWTGVYGVSFLVVLGNAWVFEFIYAMRQKRGPFRFIEAAVPLAVLVCVFIYGGTFFAYEVKHTQDKRELSDPAKKIVFVPGKEEAKEPEKTIRVAVVQGNIPQDIKWDQDYEDYIHSEYARLTREAISASPKPDLVIWPETAIPTYLRFDPKALEHLGKAVGEADIPFIVGASDAKKVDEDKDFSHDNRRYFNTAFLLVPGKGFVAQYDKVHLVPFGEYVPCAWIPFLRRLVPLEDIYTPGTEFTVFPFDIPFSVVICFEDTLPGLVRRFLKNGAAWIVNLTNDGWFRNSSAPQQHANLAKFRCVENRVWMVRSTNTGVSCFIDPFGRVAAQVEDKKGDNVWVPGTAAHPVSAGKRRTFYTQYGDVFSWANLFVLLLFVIASVRRTRSNLATTFK